MGEFIIVRRILVIYDAVSESLPAHAHGNDIRHELLSTTYQATTRGLHTTTVRYNIRPTSIHKKNSTDVGFLRGTPLAVPRTRGTRRWVGMK
jgi:hypothetical protein